MALQDANVERMCPEPPHPSCHMSVLVMLTNVKTLLLLINKCEDVIINVINKCEDVIINVINKCEDVIINVINKCEDVIINVFNK